MPQNLQDILHHRKKNFFTYFFFVVKRFLVDGFLLTFRLCRLALDRYVVVTFPIFLFREKDSFHYHVRLFAWVQQR
ncbi:MAG: hypothetical protein S4CHLAM102_04180 [Chlamydiia bacterium]|nr:hypothetical protein [Chlamydiia bacterium]